MTAQLPKDEATPLVSLTGPDGTTLVLPAAALLEKDPTTMAVLRQLIAKPRRRTEPSVPLLGPPGRYHPYYDLSGRHIAEKSG